MTTSRSAEPDRHDDGVAPGGRRPPVLIGSQAPRRRRGADTAWAGVLLGIALVLGAAAHHDPEIETVAERLVGAGPPLLRDLWHIGASAPLALAAVALVVAAWKRRLDLLAAMGVAGAIAIVASVLAGGASVGGHPGLWGTLALDQPVPWFPPGRFVVPLAVAVAAGRYVIALARQLGNVLLAASACSLAALGAARPSGVLCGLLVAAGAARAAHAALGAPVDHPDVDRVRDDLADLGIRATALTIAEPGGPGVVRMTGTDEQGAPIQVRVLGRDDRDTRLLGAAVRRVWYRHVGDPVVLGRLRWLQHDALLTLLAAAAGVRTDTVLRAASSSSGDALLVVHPAAGTHPVADGSVFPAVGPRLWEAVDALHGAGIAHGRLDAEHLVDDGTSLAVVGFEVASEASGPERRAADRAQALVTAALLDGVEPAVADAASALGQEGLAAIVSYVQPQVLTAPQRRGIAAASIGLDDLRERAAAAAGVDAPLLATVRRVSWLTLAQVFLLPWALIGLWSVAEGLEISQLGDQLRDASWTLVAIGVIVSQLPRIAQTFSALGASPVPLPIGPLYALQLAIGYVNVVIPGGAARVAINIRFFQRNGLPPGSALSVSALDGIGGLVVQATLVASMLVVGSTDLDLDLDLATSSGDTRLLGLAVVVVALVSLVLAVVPRFRRRVFVLVVPALRDALAVLRGLRSPRRLGLLIGGNVVGELAFALALASFTRALGYAVPFGELLLITMTVAILAWIIPVPGGIGVAEAGLLVGLVGAGLPDEEAFTAMVLYRLSTFYLPPAWGFFALRWLQRNQFA